MSTKTNFDVRPGDVVRLIERIPNHLDAIRNFIVWNPAFKGDRAKWLVSWAAIPYGETTYQPYGNGEFVLHLKPEAGTWESITPHVPAQGIVLIDDVTDQRYVVDKYVPTDEKNSSINAQADMMARHLKKLAADTSYLLSEAGRRRSRTRELAEIEMRALTDLVRRAAGEGMPETQIATAAQIDRMTVRKILGK